MSERDDLLASIADTIKDYRSGELPKPTPAHVDRWIRQFGGTAQLPMLREMDHVLKRTYFSRTNVRDFFARQIDHEYLAGTEPCEFWRNAHLLNIQQQGHSQREIRELFLEFLRMKCGNALQGDGSDGGAFIYLDDVLFTGSRIGNDLSAWVADHAPQAATVHVLVIASHRFGEWKCSDRLKKAAADSGKDVTFKFWSALRLENRKAYRNQSEVLWPAVIPDDPALNAYMARKQKFPFERREPGGILAHPLYSSEVGRQLLERELTLGGVRIRGFCQNPKDMIRPLGFSPFGLGFGSLIVTFRNCPNNCPLSLWWGDPKASPSHPFSKWYPLLPRKTYEPEIDFDDFDF